MSMLNIFISMYTYIMYRPESSEEESHREKSHRAKFRQSILGKFLYTCVQSCAFIHTL
jgi:hypothetical protein